jgi:hypothetical protein
MEPCKQTRGMTLVRLVVKKGDGGSGCGGGKEGVGADGTAKQWYSE